MDRWLILRVPLLHPIRLQLRYYDIVDESNVIDKLNSTAILWTIYVGHYDINSPSDFECSSRDLWPYQAQHIHVSSHNAVARYTMPAHLTISQNQHLKELEMRS